MASLIDLETSEQRSDEAVEVYHVWTDIYQTEIEPRLSAKHTDFAKNIIGVYAPAQFCEEYHNKKEVAAIIQSVIKDAIVVDGADIDYNSISDIISQIKDSAANVVIIDNFDTILNKSNCSLVDTFLLNNLEKLWESETIKVVVLLSSICSSFSLLPKRYCNISIYGNIHKSLP